MANNNNNKNQQTTKRWNKKVIETSKQWLFNDGGSATCYVASERSLYEAIAEYKRNCYEEW